MTKKVEVLKSNEEAERRVLEKSFNRSPEERIIWLISQIELMNKMNPLKKKSSGYELKRKHG